MESRKWLSWQDRSSLSTNKIITIIYYLGRFERNGLFHFVLYNLSLFEKGLYVDI